MKVVKLYAISRIKIDREGAQVSNGNILLTKT